MKFTTNYFTLGRIAFGVGALSFLPSAKAAFAQCVAGWEWSYNSEGQNPCEIAGSLQAPCLGFSVYELGPLSEGTNYVTPQKSDTAQKKCGCNTIIYSLYASCAVCQRNYTATPITWAFWSQFCDNVYVTQYPFDIPYNASVPHWTFVNYTDGAFDPVRAKAAGRDPEATPKAPSVISISSSSTNSPPSTNPLTGITSTRTSGTGTSSIPPSTSSPSTSSGGNNSGSTKTNVGAIAGGVVGGVVGLAGLVGLAFFFLKRRRGSGNADVLGPNQMAYNPANTQQPYEPPKIYNPADPSTFPSPISGDDSSHSAGYTTNYYQQGRYNGAAEL
ncbi:hypothetical protein BDM02DRAFT_2823162 [Thelephora ganbajun]|uniref:Uncharacterized protein n=1 Tax=Thelephora ganbajun TaxID=370292 RepID=A0ACB6ZC08_THEGA|nr:hypothetical protein BDM02DRAFT_2823162 [Thelephora ganbajun]